VATTFVPGAEGLEMLEKTVHSLIAMDYPHDTWVLDEGDSPRVRAMCQRLGARHFSRKQLSQYRTDSGPFRARTKYGNVNAWLFVHAFELYDVVMLFDPDHIALPSYLARVVGFFEDPSIGYVQSAQAYYNQQASLIARGAAEETYAYNSSIQMAAYALGYPVIVGSHNTHRITALRAIGGLQPHDADDLLTTLEYGAHGWRGVFVPEILARGLTPVDWPGYFTQQRRWARSVLDIKLRHQPRLSAFLGITARVMSFLHGINYLYKSVAIFAMVTVLTNTLATGVGSTVFKYLVSRELAIACAGLYMCDLFRQRFYLGGRLEWGVHWRVAALQLAKWPHMLVALWDIVLRRRLPYTITPKTKVKSPRLSLFVPHIVTLIVLIAAWAVGVYFHNPVAPQARELAGGFILSTLVLVLSGLVPSPPPFDGRYVPSVDTGSAPISSPVD